MFIMTATQSFHFHRRQLTLHVSPFPPFPPPPPIFILPYPALPWLVQPARHPINALIPDFSPFVIAANMYVVAHGNPGQR